jgi:hypothetical protein
VRPRRLWITSFCQMRRRWFTHSLSSSPIFGSGERKGGVLRLDATRFCNDQNGGRPSVLLRSDVESTLTVMVTDDELREWAFEHGWSAWPRLDHGRTFWRWAHPGIAEGHDEMREDVEGPHDKAPPVSAGLRQKISLHQDRVKEGAKPVVKEARLPLHHRVDWFLENIVSMVSSVPLGLGVTLSVGGLLVSGLVVSGEEFFELLVKQMKDGTSDPRIAESIALWWSEAALVYKKLPKDGHVSFIHLKDARYFHPGGAAVPGNAPLLWRGPLLAVDGFSMGLLKTD